MNEHELPMLAGIAGILRWLEELANILSGPLLTAGLCIALIDLLTDGALLTAQPALLYAWAISQAVGVDAQLVASWDRARQALRTRRYWSLVGLLILGAALAYVGWIAAEVFSLQQSEGLTTVQALARLGMDSATWLVSRAALSVVLVCLSGWTRYHRPAAPSLEDERAKLERELALEPLRAAVRARKAVGWRGTVDALRGVTAQAEVSPEHPTPEPPTTPGGLPDDDEREDAPETTGEWPALRMVPGRSRPSRNERRKMSRMRALRDEAFGWLDGDPTMSRKQLRDLLHCRQETANGFYAQWQHAQRQVVHQ